MMSDGKVIVKKVPPKKKKRPGAWLVSFLKLLFRG